MECTCQGGVAVFLNNLRKFILLPVLSGYLLLMTSACCTSNDLQKDQIAGMKVELLSEGIDDYIIVSGIPFHSALVIRNIMISDSGSSINIIATQQLCGADIGLPFYLKIKIKKNTKTITLGENKEIIWQRAEETGSHGEAI